MCPADQKYQAQDSNFSTTPAECMHNARLTAKNTRAPPPPLVYVRRSIFGRSRGSLRRFRRSCRNCPFVACILSDAIPLPR